MLSFLKTIRVEPQPAVRAVPERCLRRRLSTCECRLCLDGCPAGALSFDRQQLHLDQDRCTGCMACVAVCPSEAVEGSYDLDRMLQVLREQDGKTVISCIRQKRRSVNEIAIPCLGILSAEDLVALGRSGCRSIEFDLTDCPACENREAAERFLATFRRVTERVAPLFSAGLVISGTVGRRTEEGGSDRRSFLLQARGSFETLSLLPGKPEYFSTFHPEKAGGRRLPRRVRVIQKILADAVGDVREQLLSLCTHRVTAGPACTLCPLCTGICPTGALRVTGSGAARELLFTATRCSGCGLCVSFCGKSAVSLSLSPISGSDEGT